MPKVKYALKAYGETKSEVVNKHCQKQAYCKVLVLLVWILGNGISVWATDLTQMIDHNDALLALWGGHDTMQDCVDCHGQEPNAITADSVLLVEQVPMLCERCHREDAPLQRHLHGPVAKGECLLCHVAHESTQPFLLTKQTPELCTQCHENSDLKSLPHHQEPAYQSCLDCHWGHQSEGPSLLKSGFFKTSSGLAYLLENKGVLPRPHWVNQKHTLKGIGPVRVLPAIQQAEQLRLFGITDTVIRRIIEQYLRQHQVPIVSSGQHSKAVKQLVVSVRLLPLSSHPRLQSMDLLAGSIQMSLQQPTMLLPQKMTDKPTLCYASTWQQNGVVRWTRLQAQKGLEEVLSVLVQSFCEDYREVNTETVISDSTEQP